LGIRFVDHANIDTDESNPASRLLLHIFAAFAEFERELIWERVDTGIRAGKRRGKRLGRPRRVFRRAWPYCSALRAKLAGNHARTGGSVLHRDRFLPAE
jgi:DNA invertase Pin-like site-specific DNA recombinase